MHTSRLLVLIGVCSVSYFCFTKIGTANSEFSTDEYPGNEKKHAGSEKGIPENEDSYPGNEEGIPENKGENTGNDTDILENKEEIPESKEKYSGNEKDLDDDESFTHINDTEGQGFIGNSDEGFIEFTNNTKQATESRSRVPESINVKTDKPMVKNDVYETDNGISNSKAWYSRMTENPIPYNDIYGPPDPDYQSKVIIFEQQKLLENPTEDIGYLLCICEGGFVERKLPKESRHRIFLALKKFPRCEDDAADICNGLENCSRCQAAVKVCELDEPSKLYKCTENRLDYILDFNEEITYAPFESFTEDKRNTFIGRRRRAISQMCPVPARFQNVDFNCRHFLDHLKCQQRCRFGHTFKEGVTARITFCNYNEDEWRPYGIEDCLPFRDCGLRLDVSGTSSCSKGSSYTAAYCNVTCDGIQGVFEPVKKAVVCPIDGKWENVDLPYCVSPYPSGYLLQSEPKDLTFPVKDIFEEEKKKNPS